MANKHRRYPLGDRQLKAFDLPVNIPKFTFSQADKDLLSTAWKTISYNADNANNADREVPENTRYKSPINADKRKKVDDFILRAEKDIQTQERLDHVNVSEPASEQKRQLVLFKKSAESFLSNLEKLWEC